MFLEYVLNMFRKFPEMLIFPEMSKVLGLKF